MTLSTNVYVLDEVDVHELFRYCQTLLTEYDDEKRPWNQQACSDEPAKDWDGTAWVEQGRWRISNNIGQGLPAILDITYRPGRPLATGAESQQCTGDCEPSDDPDEADYHYHPHACWADIDFDTAYAARFDNGMGCGDLHAALVAEVGRWLDERNVRWEWRNEFTGDVHGGEQRYERLTDLCSGGAKVTAWYTHTALPAIAAGVLNGGTR